MSVAQVYADAGRIGREQRAQLAETLTKAIMEVEVGVDNPAARSGIMVMFHEVPEDAWAVGGSFDTKFLGAGGRVLVTLT